MFTVDHARAALAFLDRVQLRPAEIQAFVELSNALQAVANPKPVEPKSNDNGADAGK